MIDDARHPLVTPRVRDVLRAAGGVAAVALAGCSAVSPAPGDAVDCDPDLVEAENEAIEQLADVEFELAALERTYRAGGYLLEQIREGLPDEVVAKAEAVGGAARESVAYLEVLEGGTSTGHATGWFVEEGLIATNAHNVQHGISRADAFRGYTHHGRRFETTLLGYVEDISPDVAVLATDFTDAPPLPVRLDADLEAGQPLVQVGHPGGFGNWVVSAGRFAGRTRTFESFGRERVEYTVVATSIPGLRGNSGSPVLDLDGRVVAMTTGGTDVDYREFGDPVRVAPDRVFDAPISPIMASEHVDVDVTVELLDRWA